jgi:hypothetical protein
MDLAQFLRSGLGAGAPRPPLVQFKCGRCNFDRVERGLKMRLSADPRRGELRVVKDGQGVTHLQWIDRTSGGMGLDLECFPGDVDFRRISSPQPSDRIYELKFSQGGRREFFWSQEAKEAVELELALKVIHAINNTPTPAVAESSLTHELLQQAISGLGAAREAVIQPSPSSVSAPVLRIPAESAPPAASDEAPIPER